MTHFKKALLGAAFGVIATASLMPAQAVTISSPAGGFALVNLGNSSTVGYVGAPASPTANGTVITAVTPAGGLPTGLYAGSGSTFTSPFGAGSTQEYYAVQPSGSITFQFTAPRTSYGLYISTIDDYNGLSFSVGGVGALQTFSGTSITNAIGGSANGSQTRYVLFSDLTPFTTFTATDTRLSAFEFVPMAVPEPVSMAVLGAGLVGMGLLRRRSAK